MTDTTNPEGLTAQEQRIQRLVESTRAIPWEADARTWQFTYIGPQAVRALGYPIAKWFETGFWPDHIHPDDREYAIEFCEKSSHECQEYEFDYRMIAADGRVVWLHDIVVVEHENGEPAFLRGYMIDITERMNAQDELRQAHEELAQAFSEIKELHGKLEAENVLLLQEVKKFTRSEAMIGHSKLMNNMLAQASQVAKTDSTVLITGETGSGKCVLAKWIHENSTRSDKPLVQVNCSALPASLAEAELFGHEKGAYTGAVSQRLGRFQIADGATIFLDEIGDLPLEIQVKLLRVLEERQIERLGSSKTIDVDVRVIAATNKELESAMNAGEFRSDLFYRLNVFPMEVPPLRSRAEDIPALVWSFVTEFNASMDKNVDGISEADIEELQNYPWPGNVRELRNVIERAMISCTSNTLRIPLPQYPRPVGQPKTA